MSIEVGDGQINPEGRVPKDAALFRVEGISAGYGSGPVVTDLNLEIHQGELVALLGPNGAGKSTALLAMSGAIPVSSGKLFWDGVIVDEPLYKRARRGLSLVTDDRALFMRMSVMDNLLVGRCDTKYAFEIFPELVPLTHRRVGLLSGGEQQMLTMARALARRPKLLLFDELSLGLAPLAVQRLMAALLAAVESEGVAALVVEQHVEQILRVSSRAYVMSRGRVVLSGGAQEVRSRWQDLQKAYLSS
jgi:ABC-type branched-subunit amino acid transport system ATPase component